VRLPERSSGPLESTSRYSHRHRQNESSVDSFYSSRTSTFKSLDFSRTKRSAFYDHDDGAAKKKEKPADDDAAQTAILTCFPKSLSISTMLKLGTVVNKHYATPVVIDVSEFDIHKISWGVPCEKPFFMEDEPFSSGGFRGVYRVKSNGKDYVVKNFLEKTLYEVNRVNLFVKTKETVETLSRKAIQCHMLAKNFALQLKTEALYLDKEHDFGEFFSYKEARLGRKKSDTSEYVMIEEFICGKF